MIMMIYSHPQRPPVIHYGWTADIDLLLELAKELDCVKMYTRSTFVCDPDDEDLDEEGKNYVEKEEYDNSTPAQAILTSRFKPERVTRESEVRYAARRAGWDQ
ncbi:uncharacterized protein FIBRA_07753 [Fibroporia radiculosa]|uniref:Uncharacterized protein n=1 Tax=Fibroporia radiculosa TaxID=599839 RepID=J4I1A4_9APHY|nr:uncharacterized protein FIBRA_07753 [Fibroporia radiculosa]CCM05527.1 predicted protein [Fibroporia radiculosa]